MIMVLMFHFRGGLKGGRRQSLGIVSINRPASGAHPLSQAFLFASGGKTRVRVGQEYGRFDLMIFDAERGVFVLGRGDVNLLSPGPDGQDWPSEVSQAGMLPLIDHVTALRSAAVAGTTEGTVLERIAALRRRDYLDSVLGVLASGAVLAETDFDDLLRGIE